MFDNIIDTSKLLKDTINKTVKIGNTSATILIEGVAITGKDVIRILRYPFCLQIGAVRKRLLSVLSKSYVDTLTGSNNIIGAFLKVFNNFKVVPIFLT
ncbi:MAG: hypothetical protein H6Q68_1408 [Firmicutes bacterium]|nr:hypothetical protein [Bacillota bacterium]